jgi:pterin-4a-carbinolamine dehydratase
MESLLEQFLREEASSHVRDLILDAVQEHEQRSNQVRKKFEFNRFEVTLDFVSDVALIEDVLDPAPSGEVRLQLGEFIRCLSPEDSE